MISEQQACIFSTKHNSGRYGQTVMIMLSGGFIKNSWAGAL